MTNTKVQALIQEIEDAIAIRLRDARSFDTIRDRSREVFAEFEARGASAFASIPRPIACLSTFEKTAREAITCAALKEFIELAAIPRLSGLSASSNTDWGCIDELGKLEDDVFLVLNASPVRPVQLADLWMQVMRTVRIRLPRKGTSVETFLACKSSFISCLYGVTKEGAMLLWDYVETRLKRDIVKARRDSVFADQKNTIFTSEPRGSSPSVSISQLSQLSKTLSRQSAYFPGDSGSQERSPTSTTTDQGSAPDWIVPSRREGSVPSIVLVKPGEVPAGENFMRNLANSVWDNLHPQDERAPSVFHSSYSVAPSEASSTEGSLPSLFGDNPLDDYPEPEKNTTYGYEHEYDFVFGSSATSGSISALSTASDTEAQPGSVITTFRSNS